MSKKKFEFEIKKDLTQADLELWSESYVSFPLNSINSQNGAAVRAAIRAGWIVSPETEYKKGKLSEPAQYLFDGVPVGEMHPYHIRVIAGAVDAVLTEMTEVDPNS